MQTHEGDRLIVRGRNVDAPNRDGKILEVHGANGSPPYLVQWSDDGHIGLVFPGPDAVVEHLGDDASSADRAS